MNEHRVALRRRVLKAGTIEFGHGGIVTTAVMPGMLAKVSDIAQSVPAAIIPDRQARVRSAMEKSRGLTGVLASLCLVSAAVAVFAASCCMLPFVLGDLGAGAGLFSTREFLVDHHARILVFSAFLISFGWIVYLRRPGTRSIAVVLAIASLLVVTAANFETLERPLLKMVRANR